MNKLLVLSALPSILLAAVCLTSCYEEYNDSDSQQQKQQELLLKEGTAAVGMPSIKNFRERRLLKDILELRDQDGLTTYTYIWSDFQGKLVFFCNSIGYGIPYSTQYTNPSKIVTGRAAGGIFWEEPIPQADPNGLFSPGSAEGTWIMCKDPNGTEVKPVYVEPRTVVSPFELASSKPETAAKAPEPAPVPSQLVELKPQDVRPSR